MDHSRKFIEFAVRIIKLSKNRAILDSELATINAKQRVILDEIEKNCKESMELHKDLNTWKNEYLHYRGVS